VSTLFGAKNRLGVVRERRGKLGARRARLADDAPRLLGIAMPPLGVLVELTAVFKHGTGEGGGR
jgi:hypothetical protein